MIGEEHPDSAYCLNKLGALLQARGDFRSARHHYEKALRICIQVLGQEHPDTALSLHNLAMLCFFEDDFDEATKLMRQALAIRRKVLGKNHPDTISSLGSLVIFKRLLKQKMDVSSCIAMT